MDKEFCKAFVLSYISRAFLYPDDELLKALGEGLEDLAFCLKILNQDFDVKSLKIEIDKADIVELQADYTNLFLLALRAPISETAYEIDKTSRRAYELADISGFYKAFGVEVPQGIEPDHLSAELEFLSILLQKYIMIDQEEGKDVCIKAYKDFLKDHVGRWYELFTKLVNENANTSFYKTIANLMKSLIDEETKGMKIYKLFEYHEETLKGNSWSCIN